MNLYLSCGLITLILTVSWAATPPKREDVISRCLKVERPELEPCLIKIINEIRPFYAEGLPEFGLPPSNNIEAGTFNFTDMHADNHYVDGSFYDVIIKGMEDLELNKLKLDYDQRQATVEVAFPELHISGRYILNASFVVVPIRGQGTFWISLGNVLCNGVVNFDFAKEDGDYRFVTKEIELDFDYETISMRLNNLFEGNPVLKQAAEAVIQQNARELVTGVKPQLTKQIIDLLRKRSRSFAGILKFEELAGNHYIRKAFNLPS